MNDKEQPVMVCEECDLECDYRGLTPLEVEDNLYTCTMIQEDRKSCLVSVPVSVMVDTSNGNVRTVRVDFLRIGKRSRWKHRKQ